ncbi:MAG: fimbrillin family protein, partial [Alistipes sp.]|nr:fimbrillin family protein [Alistipes sp.]
MKKIRNTIRISLSAALLWGLCGCSDPEPAVPAGQPIGFIPSVVSSAQVAGTAFSEGDRIGLFCVESGSDPAAAIAGERYIDNKLFTVTQGELKSATPCFWATDYTGPSDFYAYYPYRSLGIGAGKSVDEIGVSADQRADEEYSQCDWMLARTQNVVRTKDPVRLDFKRLMSKLDFVLVPGEGYNGVDGLLGAGLQVLNVARVANVDFTTGEVSSPAIFVNVVPHGTFRAEGQTAVGVSAIVVPQTVKAAAQFVVVNIGERKFRFVTDKELTFASGKRYTFTLTVSRTAAGGEVKIQPEIEEWTEGTSSSGGTVVVDPDDDAT